MHRYFLCSFRRRSLLRSSPIRSLYRFVVIITVIFIFSSFFIPFIFSVLIFQSHSSEYYSSDTIISLTTVPARFYSELPLTIHSLLSQTELPKEIRIYLSPTSKIIVQKNLTLLHLKKSIERLDSSEIIARLFDKLVQIRLEQQDYGPATKFLPIIREFASKSQAIMVCDDDQYYHPYTLATLNTYAKQLPDSIIGFRGWRGKKKVYFHFRKDFLLVFSTKRSYLGCWW